MALSPQPQDPGSCLALSSQVCFCCCHCSVTNSSLTLCDFMDCSMLGSPVRHYVPEFAQVHVHWVDDASQPLSHLLLSPSPHALNLSQHQVFSNELALCIRWSDYWSFRSVLSMNIQGWFPLDLTGLISLQSKGLSRVFSNTTVQKHQFFGTQPSLWPNSHIHTWLLWCTMITSHSFD